MERARSLLLTALCARCRRRGRSHEAEQQLLVCAQHARRRRARDLDDADDHALGVGHGVHAVALARACHERARAVLGSDAVDQSLGTQLAHARVGTGSVFRLRGGEEGERRAVPKLRRAVGHRENTDRIGLEQLLALEGELLARRLGSRERHRHLEPLCLLGQDGVLGQSRPQDDLDEVARGHGRASEGHAENHRVRFFERLAGCVWTIRSAYRAVPCFGM